MGLCSAKEPFSLESRLKELGYDKRSNQGLKAVLKNVDVVAATCIGCGMGPLDSLVFPFIVIDEAAQVIEPAVLIPLGKGAVQTVMVGDQCQLPATVLSQEAQGKGLDISMFDRLLSMGMEYTLLSEQYRMHPSISAFPSWRFYRGELKNAVTDAERRLPQGLPFRSNLAFLHVDAVEASGGASKKNPEEAACVSWLYDLVMEAGISGADIGIISPYGAQVTEIRAWLPQSARTVTQVSTVDAFQGSEREVIILSLVRANRRGDVGFVADWRRLNVALTRAKRLCVVIGHIPTWLSSNSGLIRDWLGFHRIGRADVRAFRAGGLVSLPEDVQKEVSKLREDFVKNNPAPGKLVRAEKASRNVSAAGKKIREITQQLEDAMKGDDEHVLKSVLQQAREAGVEKSIVDEADNFLEGFAATKKLDAAIKSKDPTALVQALISAKMAGVDEEKIQVAEDLMGSLVVPTGEGAGRSFYVAPAKPAPAEKAEKPVKAQEAEPAKPAEKKKKSKAWAALTNTGPKYAGRKQEADDGSEFVESICAAATKKPDPILEPEPSKGKGKGKGKDQGKPAEPEGPEKPYLRVHKEHGAGIELTATCWGMRVDEVEAEPGQPHLSAGCTITAIDGVNLLGLPDEDAVSETFGSKFKDGVLIDVDPVVYETIPLPPDAGTWALSFSEDLDMLAGKFAVEHSISRMGLEIRGPSAAMEPCKAELGQLLDFYKGGQSAAKQKQLEIDQEAMKLAQQRVLERQRREAEEIAAWQQYVWSLWEQQWAWYQQQAAAYQQPMAQAYAQPQVYQQPAPQPVYQQPPQQQWQQQWGQPQQQQQQWQPQQQMAPPPPVHNPWVQCWDQQGQPYYYNEQTSQTAWQLPPGVVARNAAPAPMQQVGYGQMQGGYGQMQGGGYGGYGGQQSWYG